MHIRDQKKLHKENRKSLNLYSVLNQLSSLTLSQANPDRIISLTLKEIRRIFNAKLCWIFLIEDDKIELKGVGDPKSRQTLVKSQSLLKLSPKILKRTYPIICNRVGELHKKSRAMHRFIHERNINKFMGVPLKKDGKLVGTLSVARDSSSPSFIKEDQKHLALLSNMIVITKLKQAEEKSRQSQKLLEAIIDNIPNPVFIKDRKHRYVVLNLATTQLTGYSREEILGKSDYDFFPKDQVAFFWKKDEEMFRTGKVVDIPEEPITDKEGNVHYLHTKKAPLRDSSGKITHLVGIIEDITERKRTEGALRESEEKYRLLVENLNDGIYSTYRGVFTSVNESMSKMFGYSKKELLGMPSWNLAAPEIRNSVKDLFFERTAKKDYSPIEVKCVRKDGSVFIAEVRLSSIAEKQQFLGVVSDITERKQAEETLKLFSHSVDSSVDGIAMGNPKGRITYANEVFVKMFGYSREELIGKEIAFIYTKDQIPKLQKALKATMKGGWTGELVGKRKDGRLFPVAISASRVLDDEGKVVAIMASHTDISQRKQTEESLKQKVLELNSFINNIPDMAWLKDTESRFIALNKSFGDVVGMKSEALIGQTCKVCFGAEAGNKFKEDDLKVMKGKKQVSIEEKILDSKGNELRLETIKSPIFDESGKVMGTVGIARNVTERKRAEEALQISEQKFKDLTEATTDWVWEVDEKGVYTYVSPKVKELLGYEVSEVLGKTPFDFMPEGEAKRIAKFFKERLIKKESFYGLENTNRHKDGHLVVLETNGIPIFDKEGRFRGYRGIDRDITERKRAEKMLIRNERILWERARLLTDLRSLDRIDDILTRVCETIRDSGLFERAVMTLHKPGGRITYLGQVGLSSNVVKRAQQAPPIDQKTRARIASKKFRVSDSFFIPVETGVDFSKTERHVPQRRRNSVDGDWQPGDELFAPLRDFSGKIMGYLSVDTPTDGHRPDIKIIQALEMLVEAAAARVREVETHEALKRERDFSQSIIETANSMIICLDADAKITVFNQECERVTGYRSEEVLGKSWPKLFLPPDHPHFKLKSFAKWVRAHPRDRYEGPIVTKSGEIRTILWSNTAVLGSDEKEIVAIAIGHDITERKQAEEALQISQERYELSTKAANVGVWDWDIKTNKFYIDPIVKEILGYKEEEIPNDIEVWMTYVHPDDREPVMAAAQMCLDGKTPEYVFEHRMVHRDGSVRWILSRGNVMRDAKGNAVRMVGTDTDITERKQADEALQASENKYRTLLENLPQKIFLKDRNSAYVSCNESYARDLKIKSDEIAGKTDYDFFPKELAEKYRADDKRILKLGKTEDIEERYIQEGQEVFVSTVKTPVKDEQGNIIGLLGIFWDISERKRAEEALQESEEKYRELINTSVDGVISVNPQMKIILWNPGAESMFGYSEKEMLGQSLLKLAPERYRKAKERGFVEFRKVGLGPVVGKTLEFEGLRKDGTKFPIELSVSSRKIGKTYIATAIVRDITDRKRAEEALGRSERKYRTLVETAQEGIGLSDPKENLVFVNQAFADLLGYRKEELLGKNLKEISDERQYVKFKEETEKRKKGGFTKYEAKLLTKRGKPKYVYISAAPLLDEGGSFIGTLGVLTDLTDIKKAQEYNILLDTSRSLSRTLKFDRVLKIGAEKMIQTLNADRCAVLLTEADRADSVCDVQVYSFKKGGGALGHIFKLRTTREHFSAYKLSLQKQEYIQIFDARIDPLLELGRKVLRRAKINSALIIPILAGKKMLGVFHVGMAKKPRTFSTDEARLALTMANQVAVALQNCKLMEDLKKEHSRIIEQAEALKRQTREKDILLRISRALSKTMDLNEVCKVASQVVGSTMGVERCAVTLATPDGNQLEIKGLFYKDRTDAGKLIGTKFFWDDIPAMSKAIKKGKPFAINDTSVFSSRSKIREYFLKVGIKSVLGAGMFFGRKLIGLLSITSVKEYRIFTQDEMKLVQTMANQIAVAIENARLLQVVKKYTQDLKDLSAQLMEVQEKERKRIAQELHDEVGQMLQSMKMNLDRIKMNLRSKPQSLNGIEDWLLDTEKLLSETIDDIRTITFDLRPSMLDDFGLIPTLRWFIENYSRRSNIKVFLRAKDKRYRFPPNIEITLYRIIQEALTNVAKHAQATETSVMVSQKNSTVILSVRDNGLGFDTDKVLSAPKGMGLLNIKERVDLLGGSFEIISRPRKGTTLTINIPFKEVKHEEGQITGR